MSPPLLTPDQATMLLAAGMLVESVRGGQADPAATRITIEAIAASLDSPSVHIAIDQAIAAHFPADVETGERRPELPEGQE